MFDWEYYGGKHYESVFTKFYQAYILPKKFGVDKRKPHLSALIRNCEITREDAIVELKKPLYDPRDFSNDKEFVLKKLEFTEEEFDQMMVESPVPHNFYKTNQTIMRPLTILGKKILKQLSR